MGIDPSPFPPPPHFDFGERSREHWLIPVCVVVVVCVMALFLAHHGEQEAKRRRDRQQEQSTQETAACLAVGGLPHHDYKTGLIERCDR